MPQALTALKSPLVICAAISVNGKSPELVSVTCWAELAVLNCWAANVSAAGERASVAGEVPIPPSNAVWVPASSVMLNVPLRAPEAVGVNAIETVQPTPAPRLDPHVFAVILKSAPMTNGVWSPRAVPPVFEIAIFCTGLVALIVVAGKARVMGVRTIAAAGLPVPESAAVA